MQRVCSLIPNTSMKAFTLVSEKHSLPGKRLVCNTGTIKPSGDKSLTLTGPRLVSSHKL